MARQRRSDMITRTRAKLVTAARTAFAARGYAETAMEDLVADADLTRGALYHHFGGKKGLLQAVIDQIDAEAEKRFQAIVNEARTPWEGFVAESIAWIELALDPEVRRIVLLDGPAVLGDPARWPRQSACLANTRRSIEMLIERGELRNIDAEATAYIISGGALNASLWIAGSSDPHDASRKAILSFQNLLAGMRQ